MTCGTFCLCAAAVLVSGPAAAQQPSADQPQEESKRIFWIIPNYRTSPSFVDFKPLSAAEKFKVASEDAFDQGTFALAGIFAGEAQVSNQNKSFGQGVVGFGRYYAASYADFAIGDYMTEAVFPTLLHQDATRWVRSSEIPLRLRSPVAALVHAAEASAAFHAVREAGA